MNIKEFINAVQDRPQMYVEEVKLDYIYYLLMGFLGSNMVNRSGSKIDQTFKIYFSNWVLEWVKKNVNENYERRSFFWYHILTDITNSEREATELFFQLSNEFFQELAIN